MVLTWEEAKSIIILYHTCKVVETFVYKVWWGLQICWKLLTDILSSNSLVSLSLYISCCLIVIVSVIVILLTYRMVHHCCTKQKVKRGLWSPEEDEKLINHITTHGLGSWSSVPKLAGFGFSPLSFFHYLSLPVLTRSLSEDKNKKNCV